MGLCEPSGPRVLVLTALDPTTDLVLRHLHADRVPFLRLDTAQFPTDLVFSGEISAGQGWRTRIDGVKLDDLATIYYRRPGRFVFDTAIPSEMIPWCDGQARYGLWGVLESLPAEWVNPPAQVNQAEYKPRPLAYADAVGLPIPPTLITNDPERVACFAAHQRHGIVTKALYARTPRTEEGDPSGVLYTTPVPPERQSDPGIASTTHLFQATLPKAFDVRLTVVDGALFAAEIRNPGELDWRRDHRRLAYRACEVPDEIALARLTVRAGVAEGRFLPSGAYFMRHRATPDAPVTPSMPISLAEEPLWPRRDPQLPSSIVWDNHFKFIVDLHLPGLICGHSTGGLHDVVLTTPDGSQARHSPDGDLHQTGPRRLWDEIEAIHRQWREWGKPRRERFGLSATADEQWVWLDDPDSGYRWRLNPP